MDTKDIAALVLHLCGPHSGSFTGACISIDGEGGGSALSGQGLWCFICRRATAPPLLQRRSVSEEGRGRFHADAAPSSQRAGGEWVMRGLTKTAPSKGPLYTVCSVQGGGLPGDHPEQYTAGARQDSWRAGARQEGQREPGEPEPGLTLWIADHVL